MTIGLTNYQSIVNDYPIVGQLIPDSLVRNIDNVRMMFEFAAQTERDALATANRFAAAHNSGALMPSDYRNYDLFRHKTNETQVLWLRQIRAQLARIPGGSVYSNRIPWPGWLQPVRPEMPRNLVAQAMITTPTNGAAGLGAAPLFAGIAGIALLVVIGLLAAFVFHEMSTGFQSWMMLKAQSNAIETAIEARGNALRECLANGGSAMDCARNVAAAIPAPSQAAMDNFINQTTGQGFVYYAGIAAIGAAVIGIGWYGWRQGWFGKVI